MNLFTSNFLALCFAPFLFIYSDNSLHPKVNFPVPPKTDQLLFYLQRTVNTNTIIYELNTDKNGAIDVDEPIKIQWIRYATDSTYEPLNYVQKTFAYGINVQLIDPVNNSFLLRFVSYKEKPLYLMRSVIDNKYHVYIHFNSKPVILEKIYVQIDGGTYWLPEISYVEVTGTSPVNRYLVKEIIKP